MIEELERHVADPDITSYIYYEANSPEEIVDKALAYKVQSLPSSNL